MNLEGFQIDLCIFTQYYAVSDQIKNKIFSFLHNEGLSKLVNELYSDFLRRQPDESAVNLTSQQEMIDKLTSSKTIDLIDNPDGYSWTNRINQYYFPDRFPFGVILNQPFRLDYKNVSHQPLFRILFQEILVQTQWPEHFLNHHLLTTFENNSSDYRLFLKAFQDELLMRKRFLKQWIRDKLKSNKYAPPEKTVRQIAITHHYLQEAGEERYFENLPQTKKQSIKTLAKSYNISPNTFTQQYNLIHTNRSERLKNVDDLKKVLKLIPANSKAHKILIDEIRIAEQSNPIK